MDKETRAVVDTLFLMAWSDGQFVAEEKSILDRVMQRLDVPRGEIMTEIMKRSEKPPSESKLEEVLGDHEKRCNAMTMVLAVCFADSELHPGEADFIVSLASRLGITAAELDQLRQDAQNIVDPDNAPKQVAGAISPQKQSISSPKKNDGQDPPRSIKL